MPPTAMPVTLPDASNPNMRLVASPRGKTNFTVAKVWSPSFAVAVPPTNPMIGGWHARQVRVPDEQVEGQAQARGLLSKHFLLYAGRPLHEAVVARGPFEQAYADYRAGRFGPI